MGREEVAKHEKTELISDIWGRRGATYGEKGGVPANKNGTSSDAHASVPLMSRLTAAACSGLSARSSGAGRTGDPARSLAKPRTPAPNVRRTRASWKSRLSLAATEMATVAPIGASHTSAYLPVYSSSERAYSS